MSGPVLLTLPSLGRGGAERVFIDLAGALVDRGHEVHLAWAVGDGELATGIDPAVTTHDLGRRRTAEAVGPLRRLVGELQPAAVLGALFHGNLLAASAVRSRRQRPRLVFTEHIELGTLPQTAPRRLVRLSPWLVPVVYRMADAVVAVSVGVADDLHRVGHLPPRLVHHVPNPIDLERIDRLADEPVDHPWLLPEDRAEPVLVAAGRLVPVKGFDLLLRAVAASSVPVRLVILGEGPERGALTELVSELRIDERVDLAGAVANPYPAMRAADLVVSSSRTEALPTVLVEAVHLRRPVLATACSAGVRDVLGDGRLGRLCPPGNPTALAEAIEAFAGSGQISRPPPGAVARFDAGVVVRRYEELLGL